MKPLSEMTAQEMRAELVRHRDGADETVPEAGEAPTAGQLWYQLLSLDELARMRVLNKMAGMAALGSSCFMLNHDIEIRALRTERDTLTRKYNELVSVCVPDKMIQCGARAFGGPCVLPAGHNMGQADVPSNHQAKAL